MSDIKPQFDPTQHSLAVRFEFAHSIDDYAGEPITLYGEQEQTHQAVLEKHASFFEVLPDFTKPNARQQLLDSGGLIRFGYYQPPMRLAPDADNEFVDMPESI